jgi:hypothetical protein
MMKRAMTDIKPFDDDLSPRMRFALDEVEHMCTRGLTAVPVKPTQEMLTAGARAGSISIEAVMAVYTAMLRAAD